MGNGNEELVDIECEIIKETELAILVNDGDVEAWVPKSLIVDGDYTVGETTTLLIPEWAALDKGLL